MLIDSSFYIDAIRRREDVRFLLRPWIMSGQIWSCGLIRAEVLRGVVSPRIKEDLSEFFDILNEIPTDTELWKAAADLAWKLDRRGTILPMTDVVIAACALRVNKPVVTLDSHFSQVPGLRVRRHLRMI
jgi:predicted nucleic acid-binding protein